jgi:hypothetical protein
VAVNSSGIEIPQNSARAFTPHLRAASAKMKKLIGEVQAQIEGYEAYHRVRTRGRRAADQLTFERTIEAILCDLCRCELEPQCSAVYLPLSNKVLRKKSRYKGVALGKTLPDILRVMCAEEMNFLEMEKGRSTFKIISDDMNMAFAGGIQTTLWAGPKLLSRIACFGITLSDIGYDPDEEVIELRKPKRTDKASPDRQEYSDTSETVSLRQSMREINMWLAGADIGCDLDGVTVQDRRLRRIFNNSDFGQGGRLNGGFWQRMTSEQRQEHILIDADCCVELDYGQMSLTILYGLTGATPPEGDLYDLSDHGIPAEHRKGIKKCIQAVINTTKPPTRVPRGVRKHLPGKYSMRDVLSAVEKKHPEIYPLMTSGIGMQLFRKESDILVDVLITLQTKGIVALPIHDAVIVMDEHHLQATKIMKEVFREHTGLTPVVTLG